MKKEDFFEALCELDDDLLGAAETPVKKKMNRRIWGTMAAEQWPLALPYSLLLAPYYLTLTAEWL